MSVYENRLAAAEQKVTSLEQGLISTQNNFLFHLAEVNKSIGSLNKVVTQQELNSRDLNHNITMLLGIVTSQNEDIRQIKNDLSDIKQNSDEQSNKLDKILSLLSSKPE